MQIPTDKALEKVADIAGNWPVMVAVTFVICFCFIGVLLWLFFKIVKLLEKKHEEQMAAIRQMHLDSIGLLRQQAESYQNALRDLIAAVAGQLIK